MLELDGGRTGATGGGRGATGGGRTGGTAIGRCPGGSHGPSMIGRLGGAWLDAVRAIAGMTFHSSRLKMRGGGGAAFTGGGMGRDGGDVCDRVESNAVQ